MKDALALVAPVCVAVVAYEVIGRREYRAELRRRGYLRPAQAANVIAYGRAADSAACACGELETTRAGGGDATMPVMSGYDAIADAYDGWAQVGDDVAFYVEEASAVDLVVELGIGTGRVGVPMAQAGVSVIGVDSSERMLALCRLRAEQAGVSERVVLRVGDFRMPPVSERVSLVVAPFRSFSHLESAEDRGQALVAVREMLVPGGRLVFDVATPEPEQVRGAGSLPAPEREGISEHAAWDWDNRELRLALTQLQDGREVVTHLRLSWLTREEWRVAIEGAGLEVVACYGWFDRRPCRPGGYSIWVTRRPV